MKLGYSIIIAILLACGVAGAQEVAQKSKSKVSV
jgi:hypothetical protein